MPPTTTAISAAPASRSASTNSGTRVLCVPGCLTRDAHDMHIVVDRLLCRFDRRLEERTDIDVESEIGKGSRDDLHSPIVSVLPELDDKHPRPAA